MAGDRHPALLRVEEPQQQARDRRLARSARPDAARRAARLEPQVEAAEGGPVTPARSARSRPRARQPAARGARHRALRGSLTAGSRSVSSRTRRPEVRVRRELARGRGKRCDRVERRRARAARASRRARGRASPASCAATATASTPAVVSPRDEDRERIAEAGGERVAAVRGRRARGRAPATRAPAPRPRGRTRRARARRAGARPARRSARRAPAPAPRRRRRPQPSATAGTTTPPTSSPTASTAAADGENAAATPTQPTPDHERDERRAEPAHVQALQRVDVADHPRQQLAAPVLARAAPARAARCARRTARGSARAAQSEVVRDEPVEVARQRPREPEEPHGHDGDREREDRRTLGGTRDEVAGRRHQRDAEADGAAHRGGRRARPARRGIRERRNAAQRLHHAAPAPVSTITPGLEPDDPIRRRGDGRAGARSRAPCVPRGGARSRRRRARRSRGRGWRSARRGSRSGRRAGTPARDASRCRSPADSGRPPSPTIVSYPLRQRLGRTSPRPRAARPPAPLVVCRSGRRAGCCPRRCRGRVVGRCGTQATSGARPPCRTTRGRSPPTDTTPAVGSTSLSSSDATVLLPAPLGPTSATVSPGPSSRSTPSRTTPARAGYENETSSSRTTAVARARRLPGSLVRDGRRRVEQHQQPVGDGEPVRARVELLAERSAAAGTAPARARAP